MRRKYYSELDEIPIYNFNKCLEGKYNFVCVKPTDKWSNKEVEAFIIVYDKYIKKYNRQDLEGKIKLYKSIVNLSLKYVETANEYFLTQVEIKKSQIKETTNHKGDLTNSLVVLGKFQGFRLSPKETTVDEFYSILKNYERANNSK